MDYIIVPQASLNVVSRQGVDPSVDLSMRADDHFAVTADVWHTAEAEGPEAQSSTKISHDPAKFRDPECAQ
eukprot:4631004-Pyramimonas_sp.AAC.1